MVDFQKFNWLSIFNTIASTATMKRNQTRCLRAEISEKALMKHSDGQLEYVGDTMNGVDFIDSLGIKYECKSRDKMFISKNGYTKEIILKNFYRKSTPTIEQTFDKMILIDSYSHSVGVVDYKTAIANAKITDSIITTKIKLDEIEYIAQNVVTTNTINFEHILNRLIYNHI